MHIRPPIETDMTNLSHTSSSYSDQDSLIPRLSGYGDHLDDRDDTESEEEEDESEDEEEDDEQEQRPISATDAELQDESAIDMDLTVDHRDDDKDDKTQDLTAAIASISDRGDEGSEPDDSDTDGEQSMEFTHITTNGPRTARRRSSGAMSAATDTGSIDMDITGVHVDEYNVDMDITGVSTATSQQLSEDEDEGIDGNDQGEDDDDGMDLTMPFAPQPQDSPAKDSPIPKSKLRARDSLAALSKFGRRSLGRKRPSIAPAAVHNHPADDSGTSAMQVEELTPTRPTTPKRETSTASTPSKSNTALPLASPAPATPSRFRQSFVGGLSASPKSPARRVQVPVKPGDNVPLAGIRKSLSFGAAAPTTPSRTTMSPQRVSDPTKVATPVATRPSLGGGGALPSAFSLKPGKVPTPFKSRIGAANNARSSIVAAVLPASGRDDEDHSGENPFPADDDGDQHTHDGDEDPANTEPPPRNITLSEFFSLSGMNFHDETKPIKVRVVPPTKRENEDDDDDPQGQLKAAELNAMRFKAMAGGVPMLESLAQACRELKKSVAEGSVVLRDIEERFVESPPDLVRELLSLSSEAEKKEMESQFKLQKQAARAIAREGYLGWCLDNQYGPEMVSALKSTKALLEGEVESLQADADQMQESILPTLRQRRDELRRELERLRDRQAEIDATPREDLEELHAGMAELVPELQSRRAVQREKTSAMERMQTKLRENQRRKAELEREISQHRKTTEQIQGYTRHEASRLAAEIRNLEKIHLWKILKASLTSLHLEHDSTFDLVVTLGPGARAQQIDLTVVGELQEDVLTQEVAAMLRVEFADVQEAYAAGADMDEAITVPPLVRHISTVWTSIVHLRSELSHLEAFYPMKRYEIQADSSPRTLCVSYDIMLPSQAESATTSSSSSRSSSSATKLSLNLNVDVESLIFDIGEGANSEELIGNQLALFAQGVTVQRVYGSSVDTKRISEMQARIRAGIVGKKGFLLGLGRLARIVRDVCRQT